MYTNLYNVYQGEHMKIFKIVLLLILFIFLAQISFAQYEINKYVMGYDERETVKVMTAVAITFVLCVCLIWAMTIYSQPIVI